MFEPRSVTVTVDRRRLIEVLDIVGDAAGALERLNGDPDLVLALRFAIAEVAADLDAADLIGALDTSDDPVQALEHRLSELEQAHVDQRERHHAGLAAFGAAVPVTCHHCGVPIRTRFVGTGWAHPRTDCPYAKNPRPADRRASAEVIVRVAPEHEPVVRRSGGDLLVSLTQPDYQLAGVKLVVAVPLAAARRWAIRLASGIGQSLAAAERGENEYGEPLNQAG
ncbi:MAG: hypothetical protein QOD57_402 [Actinomycetota bacterium]|jgi:hypothetical protein|nr:hypothetical protein [Actinomycetota bacterium]MDQ1502137.1 hypothetical protein [Actinomycetota bacterium]MDQ1502675.1 hypothetical protein [Actinomycetota bacterium]MDQ1566058.1 hypothetical protein [Actinomycetota bacterium]